MLISDFDYELPEELIARYPTAQRRGSRLLVVDDGLRDLGFGDLPSLLRPNDLLVFNDTRVIKARLHARKETGGKAEILIERIQDDRRALAHVRASKTPKPGARLLIDGGASATVLGRDDDLSLTVVNSTVGHFQIQPVLESQAKGLRFFDFQRSGVFIIGWYQIDRSIRRRSGFGYFRD